LPLLFLLSTRFALSIGSGVVVTRVSSDEEQANLGRDIGQQMLSQPKALLIAGGMLLGFALIPGFPKIQFLLLGLAVGSIGYGLFASSKKKVDKEPTFEAQVMRAKKKQRAPGVYGGEEFSITVPLLIDIDSSTEDFLDPNEFNGELARIRVALYHDLGVPFPGVHLRFNENLSNGTYVILLQEIPVGSGKIRQDNLLFQEKTDILENLSIPYEKEERFLPNTDTVWVPGHYREMLTKSGFPFMEGSKIISFHLALILKKYAGEFIGLQETKTLLDKMEKSFPELVKEVSRVLPLQKMSEIFKRLVQEQISIRDLRTILEAIIEWGTKEKDVVLLAEYVRSSLRRQISYKYSGGKNLLAVYLLDPQIEETIRQAIRQTSGGSYLALDPSKAKAIGQSIKNEVGTITAKTMRPVLLTSMDVRRYVRKLIETELEELPVISYQELTPDISLQPLGRIRIA